MDTRRALLVLLALSALVWSAGAQSCEQVHYQRCLEQLVRFVEKDDLIFALSEHELKQQCVQAQSALGCITRYIKKCVGLDDRKEYLENISGIQKVTDGLCSQDSDLRARYLESLPCLQNASEGIRFCQEKFKRNQNDILLVSYEDKTPLYCCSFDGYRRCMRMTLRLHERCRDGPSAVVDEIMLRAAGLLGEGACEPFADRCTGASDGSRTGAGSSVIAVMLAGLLLACALSGL